MTKKNKYGKQLAFFSHVPKGKPISRNRMNKKLLAISSCFLAMLSTAEAAKYVAGEQIEENEFKKLFQGIIKCVGILLVMLAVAAPDLERLEFIRNHRYR